MDQEFGMEALVLRQLHSVHGVRARRRWSIPILSFATARSWPGRKLVLSFVRWQEDAGAAVSNFSSTGATPSSQARTTNTTRHRSSLELYCK